MTPVAVFAAVVDDAALLVAVLRAGRLTRRDTGKGRRDALTWKPWTELTAHSTPYNMSQQPPQLACGFGPFASGGGDGQPDNAAAQGNPEAIGEVAAMLAAPFAKRRVAAEAAESGPRCVVTDGGTTVPASQSEIRSGDRIYLRQETEPGGAARHRAEVHQRHRHPQQQDVAGLDFEAKVLKSEGLSKNTTPIRAVDPKNRTKWHDHSRRGQRERLEESLLTRHNSGASPKSQHSRDRRHKSSFLKKQKGFHQPWRNEWKSRGIRTRYAH